MINAIIVDDEKNGRELLQILLREHCPEVNSAGVAEDMQKAIELIKQSEPDLLFLDIRMPGGSGFDLLEALGDRSFSVIFVTAYHEHAIKAFKFSAIDYLLKPIDEEELVKAVQKVEKQKRPATLTTQEIKNVKTTYDSYSNNRLALTTRAGLVFVEIREIMRCEAFAKYTTCYLNNGREIVVTRNLKEFEDVLEGYNFVRLHHAHLVNMDYIKEYHNGRGGYITMTDGTTITVSQRKKEDFLKRLNRI